MKKKKDKEKMVFTTGIMVFILRMTNFQPIAIIMQIRVSYSERENFNPLLFQVSVYFFHTFFGAKDINLQKNPKNGLLF